MNDIGENGTNKRRASYGISAVEHQFTRRCLGQPLCPIAGFAARGFAARRSVNGRSEGRLGSALFTRYEQLPVTRLIAVTLNRWAGGSVGLAACAPRFAAVGGAGGATASTGRKVTSTR